MATGAQPETEPCFNRPPRPMRSSGSRVAAMPSVSSRAEMIRSCEARTAAPAPVYSAVRSAGVLSSKANGKCKGHGKRAAATGGCFVIAPPEASRAVT
eukprot:scaffold11461_cov104-Isochrysis_galbana.AAC.7